MQQRYTKLQFQIISGSIAISALLVGCLLFLLDAFFNGADRILNGLILLNIGLLGLVAYQYKDGRTFFFSGGFWVIINMTFYIILKAFDLADDGRSAELLTPLLAAMVFITCYLLGRTRWSVGRWQTLPGDARTQIDYGPTLYRWLTFTFIFFKLFNLAALQLTGAGGDTALEVSKSTQNLGAGYLFRIEGLAQASYLSLLIIAYQSRRYVPTVAVMTVYLLLEYAYHAGRSAIVTLVFIHLFLYHLNIRPVRYLLLLLLAPPMLFVIAFFGYVRDIELGNVEVYISALQLFMDDVSLVSKLFMARMDMLPQIISAFQLDAAGQLAHLYGKSYAYMFLHAVPRSLWPDKPPLTAAYLTELTHPGAFADGVNLYPSILVEGFMNFGWFGIGLAGLAIAKLTQVYERLLYSGQVARQAFALMIFTFPMGLINEGLHSNNMAGLLYGAFLYWVWLKMGAWIVGSDFRSMHRDASTPVAMFSSGPWQLTSFMRASNRRDMEKKIGRVGSPDHRAFGDI
jgi:hypothetical protein